MMNATVSEDMKRSYRLKCHWLYRLRVQFKMKVTNWAKNFPGRSPW